MIVWLVWFPIKKFENPCARGDPDVSKDLTLLLCPISQLKYKEAGPEGIELLITYNPTCRSPCPARQKIGFRYQRIKIITGVQTVQ